MAAYYLTDDDVRVLREMIREFDGRSMMTTGRPAVDWAEHMAPEVYAAVAPAGGIPGYAGGFPGTAEVSVYAVTTAADGTDSFDEMDVGGLTLVYNPGGAVPAGFPVVILRDKYGSWFVATGGGSTPFVRLLEDTRWPYWTGAVLQDYDADGEFVDRAGDGALVSVKPPDADVVGFDGQHWQATDTGRVSPDPLPADETTGTSDDTLDEPGRPRYRLERDTDPSGCGEITSNTFTVTTDRCIGGVMTTVDTDYRIVLDLTTCTMTVSVVAGTGS